MKNDVKEKLIQLFEIYFSNIESEYDITKEEILYLKNKIKEEVEEII